MRRTGPLRLFAWDLAHKLAGSDPPLVVCAESDPAKCEKMKIDGAIAFIEFEARLGSISTGREIVFYDSAPMDEVASRRASEYEQRGYSRAKVLSGGMEAWNAISSFRPRAGSAAQSTA